MKSVTCPCGKTIEKYTSPSRMREGKGKYCNNNCMYLYKDTPWLLKYSIKPGEHRNSENEFKKQDIRITGANNPMWKGDDAGYNARHNWIKRQCGKAYEGRCSECGEKNNLEWANISYEYKREVSDWKILCAKHHDAYDRKNGWGYASRKFNL